MNFMIYKFGDIQTFNKMDKNRIPKGSPIGKFKKWQARFD
jgi:hypothetical protein